MRADYINLIQGSAGTRINDLMKTNGELEPCGGACLPEAPVCKLLRPANVSKPHPDFSTGGFMENTTCWSRPDPQGRQEKVPCPAYDNGHTCFPVQCPDLAPYCGRIDVIGIRARQICPVTCGCALPQSRLALSSPVNGCPETCSATYQYREALRTTPCVDVARNDSEYLGFLDQWQEVSKGMNRDWDYSGVVCNAAGTRTVWSPAARNDQASRPYCGRCRSLPTLWV